MYNATTSHPYITVYEQYSMSNLYHTYVICLSGQWILPTVSGDCPPPCDFVTLTPLTDDTFIMFGGRTHDAKTNAT